MARWQGLIKEYFDYLPVSGKTPVITLNEGNTPLIESVNLVKLVHPGIKLYYKFEGLNPTGSFKDRGMTMAVSKAVEEGSKAIICASTGNTSAAAAAYAARAGITSYVLIPEGKIALGKLSQAVIYGAKVIQIDGNFDQALKIVREISDKYPITLVNSVNPYRIEGQKTAAFEVCGQLDRPPTHHILPVGNAGNITAYWKGYKEFFDRKKIAALPRMMGFQAAGSAPIVLGHPVEHPETVATAIRIGNPASWNQAVTAVQESQGAIDMVTDEEILDAYQKVASMDGVFCEPASAASIAGLIKLSGRNMLKEGDVVVCTLTGNGLKDPDNAMKFSDKPLSVKADMAAVTRVLGF